MFWVLLTAMSPPPVSDYESAVHKIETIEEERATRNSTVTLTSAEINAYARVAVAEAVPGGLRFRLVFKPPGA